MLLGPSKIKTLDILKIKKSRICGPYYSNVTTNMIAQILILSQLLTPKQRGINDHQNADMETQKERNRKGSSREQLTV
uniref:Ovule protein n=1 Tax=Panagrolaimus sp. JU765 TaxID=591449 RepID=A0AC34PUM7_9BILA